MPYRIELVEQGSVQPYLIWEIGDEVVRRKRLDDAAALATYIARMLRLTADPEAVSQCAIAASHTGNQKVTLRVRELLGPTPPAQEELIRLRDRNQQLEQQATHNRNRIAELQQSNQQLRQQAATATARANQAEREVRVSNQNAETRVAAAEQARRALQAKIDESKRELQLAKAEVRRLNHLRDAVEEELRVYRRQLAAQATDQEEKQLR